MLAPGDTGRFAAGLLRQALEDDATRYATLAWLRGNADALAANTPPEAQAVWATWAGGACTQRERSAFVEVFEQRSAKTDAGPRQYGQALERIDACLAMRRAQQAPLAAFVAVKR